MRAILKFLVVAAALVLFAWWLIDLPGSVSISVGTVSMAAPTSLAILAALLFVIALYFVVALLFGLIRLPSRTRRLKKLRDRGPGGRRRHPHPARPGRR